MTCFSSLSRIDANKCDPGGNIQMMHDGECDTFTLHMLTNPKLKCQHDGKARLLTFQLRDIYICDVTKSVSMVTKYMPPCCRES